LPKDGIRYVPPASSQEGWQKNGIDDCPSSAPVPARTWIKARLVGQVFLLVASSFSYFSDFFSETLGSWELAATIAPPHRQASR